MTPAEPAPQEIAQLPLAAVRRRMEARILGQEEFIEHMLIALLAGGHLLVEGVPGLAKTRAVKVLSRCLKASFHRVQFTPDLLPSDLTGTDIFRPQTGEFEFRAGPVFHNLLLADEINRAPAKVQSALLESMQERQVTLGDETYCLDDPFLVMATQNPIEQEGTYPLPEAQVDRFMLKIKVGYPDRGEERRILERMADGGEVEVAPVVALDDVRRLRAVVQLVYMDDKIKDYIVNLVYATRLPQEIGLEDMVDLIEYGASPRATIFLARAARAHAFMRRRAYVTPEDVKAIGADVLRHRILVSYEAEAEEIDAEQIVRRLFDHVEVP